MLIPPITTKFYILPPCPDIVPRSRLSEWLKETAAMRLILVVSAPAGYDKITWVKILLSDMD